MVNPKTAKSELLNINTLNTRTVHRREVISKLGLLSVSISLLSSGLLIGSEKGARESLEHALGASPAIRRVGLAYLKMQNSVKNIDSLFDALDGLVNRETLLKWRYSGHVAVDQRIRERIRSDFAEQRTVNCDGWVLSLTEARLCAAALLIA
jgi:hypothetical protein